MDSRFRLQLLSAFVDETLEMPRQLDVEARLEQDPVLRAEVQALRRLCAAIRANGERYSAPDGLHARRRIVACELICFEWQGELWLPLLQFDPVDMSLQPALAQVAAELATVFEAWELCCWLATPNSSLDDRAPLDVLEHDSEAVLQTARLDRFIACG